MEKSLKKRVCAARLLRDKRIRCIAALSLLMLLLHFLKGSGAVMNFLTDNLTHPVRGVLAAVCSLTVWSVAEWMVILAAVCAVLFFVRLIFFVITRKKRPPRAIYRLFSLGVVSVLIVSLLMTLLWNVNYYADSFQQKSGIYATESSVGELYETTLFYAKSLSETAERIARDENGVCAEDIDAMFDLSPFIFREIEKEFPFLAGKELRSKKVLFSGALSEIRTTGVAFPLTGEANINIRQPTAWIPVTIAHEIAHQRKVASEQEANFVAVLACERSGNDVYRYSGSLLAYSHLARALSAEDYELFDEIHLSLPEGVKADLRYNSEYWRQFESKVSEISDSLYDDYLKRQGQDMGTKSYGAVVDLLVAYHQK